MLPNMVLSSDFVGFVFRVNFVYDENSDAKRLRKEMDNVVRGVFGSGFSFNLSEIEEPVKNTYRSFRDKMKKLLSIIIKDFEYDVNNALFNVPNNSTQTISVVGGKSFTWDPLAESTQRYKDKVGANVHKEYKHGFRNLFSVTIPSYTPYSIDIKAGFNVGSEKEAVKVYAGEVGAMREKSSQPARPILEPLFGALYNGFETHFVREFNDVSNRYTDIREIFNVLIGSKVWQSWWVLW